MNQSINNVIFLVLMNTLFAKNWLGKQEEIELKFYDSEGRAFQELYSKRSFKKLYSMLGNFIKY